MGQSINRRRVFGGGKVNYMKQPLTFVSLEDYNTIIFKVTSATNLQPVSLYVSKDKNSYGELKTATEAGTALATLNAGEKLYVRVSNYTTFTPYSNGTDYHIFSSTGYYAVEGNIMSLLYHLNFDEQTALPSGTYTFYRLFFDELGLTDISNLVMPATTLRQGCYERMFQGSGITSLPENLLPATTLATSCYYNMFYGCAITAIPGGFLPATTLADSCYYSMFSNTSITTLPSGLLPATTLASSCYRQMFYGCASLATVASDLMGATTLASACCRGMFSACSNLQNSPDLNAKTLVTDCYRVMFNACTSITYIKCTATSISASNATNAWLGGASSTGTFVRASGVSWGRNTSGVPSGWTLVNA